MQKLFKKSNKSVKKITKSDKVVKKCHEKW